MAIEPPEVDVTDDPTEFAEAIKRFRQRVPMADDDWQLLSEAEREFAFKVANVVQAEMAAQVWDGLSATLETGGTLEDFAARVGDVLEQSWGGENPGLLENVLRTNSMSAYSAGRYEIHTAPAVMKRRPYWRFDAIVDGRTTEVCHECDGVIVEADSSWWNTHHAPLHFQCRSHVTALTEKEAQREGITAHPPAVKAMEGFGKRPSGGGRDWTPETIGLPAPIKAELEDALT